jgi:hypothetical protein
MLSMGDLEQAFFVSGSLLFLLAVKWELEARPLHIPSSEKIDDYERKRQIPPTF